MKYANANDVLPKHLLEQIRRYAGGCMLYIPQKPGSRGAWGAKSGARAEYARRNGLLRAEYSAGCKLDALAERYGLSIESIKRIVYSRK